MDDPGRINPRTQRSKVSPEELARLAREMDQKPAPEPVRPGTGAARRVERTGGARVGWISYIFPFAHLNADETGLRLRAGFSNYQLAANQIVSLSAYKGWFGRGVRIEHRGDGVPEKMIFWCLGDVALLLDELGRLGLPVV